MQADRKFIIALLFVMIAMAAAWGASVPRNRVSRNRNAAARASRAEPATRAQASAIQPAEKAEASDGPQFADFNLILARNIFDASRRPMAPRRSAAQTSDTTPIADSIDLLGVMIDANKSVAFTEGSKQDFTQTLEPGGSIAGLKIASISTEGLKLEGAGDIEFWKVGTRLYRRENESWKIGASPRFSPRQIQSTRQNNQPRQALGNFNRDQNSNQNWNQNRWAGSGAQQNERGNRGERNDWRNRDRTQNSGAQPQPAAARPARAATPQATPATSGASVDEIMARMREQRRREMGQ